MSVRTTNILGYLTLFAMLGAIWVMFGEDPRREQGGRGERTFIGLEERVNEVDTVVLKQGDNIATLKRNSKGWGMQERAGYKVAGDKVINFLRAIALSDRREPKTTNKDRYHRLGLGEKAMSITLLDDTGGVLLAFDMGNRSGRADGKSLTYVSQARDTRSWLVTELAEASADPAWWLDTGLVGIDQKRVNDVRLGSVWLTRKLDESNFAMQGLRDGEEAVAHWQLREPARVVTGLSFDDVKQLANPLSDPIGTTVLTTHDGLSLTLELYTMDEGVWAQMSAKFDAELQRTGAGGVLEGAPEDGLAEAVAINAKVSGWFFKLSQSDADVLTRKRSDFLKIKTE